MTRSLGSNFDAALTADVIRPFFAVDLNFDDGNVRVWTGYGNLTIDSETYVGAGDVMSISPFDETGEIRANGVSIGFTGLPSSLISPALSQDYQGRTMTLYFGTLDASGTIIDTPYVAFRGQMDVMNIQESGDSAQITINGESRLIDLDVPRVRRYTSEDQKIDFPNDKGLEFIADLQDKEIVWGG
jgi:hypothetical protein